MPETLQLAVKTIREDEYPEADAGKVERRVMAIDDIEMRVTDDENPRITGYAAKFGIFTDLGWFKEKIRAGAFDEALKTSDVRCLKNHDPNLILGRTTSKTLRLETNSVGLKFDNDMPNTTTGKDTREEIRRGDISGCSFSFTVDEEDWKHFKDDPSERTIIKIGRLFDVGPVTYPAYPDTTVAARSLEKFKESNQIATEVTPMAQAEGTEEEELTEKRREQKVTDDEETEESKKIKREWRLDIQRKRREIDCIHKRAIDQINEIETIESQRSAEV